MMDGATRTLFKRKLDVSVLRIEEPLDVTRIRAPLTTVIEE
jgi:hypothetical protein